MTMRAYYIGEHGPVWAGGRAAATRKMSAFPKITGGLEERDASSVPAHLQRDERLLGIGRPCFTGSGYHGR